MVLRIALTGTIATGAIPWSSKKYCISIDGLPILVSPKELIHTSRLTGTTLSWELIHYNILWRGGGWGPHPHGTTIWRTKTSLGLSGFGSNKKVNSGHPQVPSETWSQWDKTFYYCQPQVSKQWPLPLPLESSQALHNIIFTVVAVIMASCLSNSKGLIPSKVHWESGPTPWLPLLLLLQYNLRRIIADSWCTTMDSFLSTSMTTVILWCSS